MEHFQESRFEPKYLHCVTVAEKVQIFFGAATGQQHVEASCTTVRDTTGVAVALSVFS